MNVREPLFAVALATLVAVVGAASGTEEGTAGSTDTMPVQRGQYGEAPMLAALVDAGELPPVAERLPDNPITMQPYQGVGQYGGTLRSWMSRPGLSFMYPQVWKAEQPGRVPPGSNVRGCGARPRGTVRGEC